VRWIAQGALIECPDLYQLGQLRAERSRSRSVSAGDSPAAYPSTPLRVRWGACSGGAGVRWVEERDTRLKKLTPGSELF
jgi:hypothetical protein